MRALRSQATRRITSSERGGDPLVPFPLLPPLPIEVKSFESVHVSVPLYSPRFFRSLLWSSWRLIVATITIRGYSNDRARIRSCSRFFSLDKLHTREEGRGREREKRDGAEGCCTRDGNKHGEHGEKEDRGMGKRKRERQPQERRREEREGGLGQLCMEICVSTEATEILIKN